MRKYEPVAPVLSFIPGTLLLVLEVFAAASCSPERDPSGIAASGTLEARQVRIAAKTPGEILDIAVEEGARVEIGDLLVRIDHAALDIQLRQAEAGVEMARAQLDLLEKGARKEDIRQAAEQLRQVETSLKTAETDFRRISELEKNGSATLKQREDAEARYHILLAQRNAATEAVSKLHQLVRPEEIRIARARLAQAETQAELLAKTISDCAIRSPVPGIATGRPAEPGEFVAAGTTVLTVSPLDEIHLKLYVTPLELPRIALGDRVDVAVDAFAGRTFAGRVVHISPEAEFTPKNVQTRDDRVKLVFEVKVLIPNPEGVLKPGLPADAVIVTGAAAR